MGVFVEAGGGMGMDGTDDDDGGGLGLGWCFPVVPGGGWGKRRRIGEGAAGGGTLLRAGRMDHGWVLTEVDD